MSRLSLLLTAGFLAISAATVYSFVSVSQLRDEWSQHALLLAQGDLHYDGERSDALYEKAHHRLRWHRRLASLWGLGFLVFAAHALRRERVVVPCAPASPRMSSLATVIDGLVASSVYLIFVWLASHASDAASESLIYAGGGMALSPLAIALARGTSLGAMLTKTQTQPLSAPRCAVASMLIVLWPLAIVSLLFGVSLFASPHLSVVGETRYRPEAL